jgi:hypothetical protein
MKGVQSSLRSDGLVHINCLTGEVDPRVLVQVHNGIQVPIEEEIAVPMPGQPWKPVPIVGSLLQRFPH